MELKMNPTTLQSICQILIAIGLIIAALGGFGSFHFSKKVKVYISPEEKEKFAPKADIKLYPFPSGAATPYKYPLKQYVLGIQNLNKNSVPILDFRVEFIFKNAICEIKTMPLVDSGGDVSVIGMQYYEEQNDGTTFSYEELPLKTSITENFSLEIQKAMIDGKNINTNIIIFNCARWPEGSAFSSNIVVDLHKKPHFLKKPDKVGTYEGKFYYEINGKKFSDKIEGIIPAIEVSSDCDKNSSNRKYWAEKLSEVDANEGSIVYTTDDSRWLEKNNYFIDFVPKTKTGDFKIHIFRDKDNIFKVAISTAYSNNIFLKYEDLQNLKGSKKHPKHTVIVTWEKAGEKLYIDGILVDSHERNQ